MIKINCPKCGHKAAIVHFDWHSISCLRCKEMIKNPIVVAIDCLQTGFTVDDRYKSFFLNLMERSVIQRINQLKEGGE